MSDVQKSMLLFIFACIPVRLSFVWIAKYKQEWLDYMAVVAAAISIGFSIIYIFNLRKTGGEVFGDKIWWNDLRPVHAVLYAIFAYLAIIDPENAWKPLAADVSLGIVAFILHRVLFLL